MDGAVFQYQLVGFDFDFGQTGAGISGTRGCRTKLRLILCLGGVEHLLHEGLPVHQTQFLGVDRHRDAAGRQSRARAHRNVAQKRQRRAILRHLQKYVEAGARADLHKVAFLLVESDRRKGKRRIPCLVGTLIQGGGEIDCNALERASRRNGDARTFLDDHCGHKGHRTRHLGDNRLEVFILSKPSEILDVGLACGGDHDRAVVGCVHRDRCVARAEGAGVYVACSCAALEKVHRAFDVAQRRLGPAHGDVGAAHGNRAVYLGVGRVQQRDVQMQVERASAFGLGAGEGARDVLRDGTCFDIVEEFLKLRLSLAVNDEPRVLFGAQIGNVGASACNGGSARAGAVCEHRHGGAFECELPLNVGKKRPLGCAFELPVGKHLHRGNVVESGIVELGRDDEVSFSFMFAHPRV